MYLLQEIRPTLLRKEAVPTVLPTRKAALHHQFLVRACRHRQHIIHRPDTDNLHFLDEEEEDAMAAAAETKVLVVRQLRQAQNDNRKEQSSQINQSIAKGKNKILHFHVLRLQLCTHTHTTGVLYYYC